MPSVRSVCAGAAGPEGCVSAILIMSFPRDRRGEKKGFMSPRQGEPGPGTASVRTRGLRASEDFTKGSDAVPDRSLAGRAAARPGNSETLRHLGV